MNINSYEIFDNIIEIHSRKDLSINDKLLNFRYLLNDIINNEIAELNIQFSNMFSKVAYISKKYNFNKQQRWKFQNFRFETNKLLSTSNSNSFIEEDYLVLLKNLCETVSFILNSDVPEDLSEIYKNAKQKLPEIYKGERIDRIRAKVEKIDFENNIIYCYPDKNFEGEIKVKFNEPIINVEFNLTVNLLKPDNQINLIEVLHKEELFYPKYIVFEPDYLLDVSAVSESFKHISGQDINSHFYFFIQKFKEKPLTGAILLGNIANMILDEFVTIGTNISFDDFIGKTFKEYPFEFTKLFDNDDDLKKLIENMKTHYLNLKRVVDDDFKTEDIDKTNSILEPTFICETFGFQGRLDLLDLSEKKKIIELKSGSLPFKCDISHNHRAQVTIYRLMLISALKLKREEIRGSICYSKDTNSGTNLRSAEIVEIIEKEIINIRNQIVHFEYAICDFDIPQIEDFFKSLTISNLFNNNIPTWVYGNPNLKFFSEDIDNFQSKLKTFTVLEKKYFFEFIKYISTELKLSKVGDGSYNKGFSSLWYNNEIITEDDKFNIIENLTVDYNNIKIDKPEKTVLFIRNNENKSEVNFRKGDICVIYPKEDKNQNALTSQVLKGIIKEIRTDSILISFRFQQNNTDLLTKNKKFAIEHDVIDLTYTNMFSGLFSFINSEKKRKDIILGIERPEIDKNIVFNKLGEEQNRIISKALSAKDYFLIVGPPGTGKTSYILKNLTRELFNEEKNILLLAFTNRAVDEICDAVNEAIINFDDMNTGEVNFGTSHRNFIRIGSENGTEKKHHHNLLTNITKSINNRKDIKELISKHKIFISTIASISNKPEIFDLKKFDIAIIDEASQILEPQLVGILHKVKKHILIGDHKQLPAISMQDKKLSKVNDNDLNNIYLTNKANSYFERILKLCDKNEWSWAYDSLTIQGRMHEEIELFPKHCFYEDKLNIAGNEHQTGELEYIKVDKTNNLEYLISQKRLVFIPSHNCTKDKSIKINSDEAVMVSKIVSSVIELYKKNNLNFNPEKSIGIISPFRNQIATIKAQLEEDNVLDFEKITVDTVERYQGSQRDIIIYSFSINSPFQLKNLVNLDDEEIVDRKLNVALTRARKQIIFIGNEQILSINKVFFKLIEFIKTKHGYISEGINKAIQNNFIVPDINTDQTVEGKLFSPDESFKSVFDKLVINVLKEDSRTSDYPNKVLGATNDYIRNSVIEYGRANFDQNIFGFSALDKVNLYCYFNMRKHYYSSYAIFESQKDFFINAMNKAENRIQLIDFGCGPLTSGLAFNQYFRNINDDFYFNYLGIDISNSMIKKAREFSQTELFSNKTKFNFYNQISEIKDDILENIFNRSSLIIYNFSYFFANVDEVITKKIATFINEITVKYPFNNFIIIYQNPSSDIRNRNFYLFKKLISINKIIVTKKETVSYRNNLLSWYDNSEKIYYEILNN